MHLLFTYGTLQDAGVQRAVFGREVPAKEDALEGHRLDTVTITDADVLAKSGRREHPIVRPGAPDDAVPGSSLELTDDELAAADRYEVDDYVRVRVVLRSGVAAWVYMAAGLAVPMAGKRLEVTKTIHAPAEAVFAVVSDPRGHVAVDGSGMLQHVNDGGRATKAGDTFEMHMDGRSRPGAPQREYDMVVHIEKLVLNEEIAWTTGLPGRPKIGHLYGYVLTPKGAGQTEVTLYHDWSAINPENRVAVRFQDKFPLIDATTLGATLDRLADVVRTGL